MKQACGRGDSVSLSVGRPFTSSDSRLHDCYVERDSISSPVSPYESPLTRFHKNNYIVVLHHGEGKWCLG